MRRRPQITEVPDVVGFQAGDACAMVRAAGLVPYGPEHSAEPTSGVVTAQRPVATAGAARGAAVVLWTSDRPDSGELVGLSPLAPASSVTDK